MLPQPLNSRRHVSQDRAGLALELGNGAAGPRGKRFHPATHVGQVSQRYGNVAGNNHNSVGKSVTERGRQLVRRREALEESADLG